jgi:two-component system response regulator AauR
MSGNHMSGNTMSGNKMSDYQVLLVEDDADVRLGCLQAFGLEDVAALGVESVEQVPPGLLRQFAGVVVSDIRLPGIDGMAWLRQLMRDDAELPVILITGHGDVAMAVQAMREGAYDFIQKPFLPDQLLAVVRRALDKRRLTLQVRQLKGQLARLDGLDSRVIGHSQPMVELRELIADVAAAPADVLILGETGTGKELIARSLHEQSGRSGPFVAINCGGLPETLFDAEIFGHEVGAFSGAAKQRIGKIEYAHNGTLFLDEIESMPLVMQIKLLRVLQERVVERLGSNRLLPVNVRVIAATKADLLELSEQGKFRSDLYFRLNVVTIDLPPLRERRADIPLLFDYFVALAALRMDRPQPEVRPAVLHELMAHQWPGNVRELRNQADRFVLGLKSAPGREAADKPVSLSQAVELFERGMIVEELRRNNGNMSRAAEALHIAKTTLFDKIKKYAIDSPG